MGLKYCLETPRPWQKLQDGLHRFHRAVHLHFFFKSQDQDTDSASDNSDADRNATYIPSLYRPSEWNPPIVNRDAERALHKFDQRLTAIEKNLPKFRKYNLTPSQRYVLKELARRSDLVVFPTDKGLGPSISNRTHYIRQVLTEHLLNSENYSFIPPDNVETELAAQRARFLAIYGEWSETLPSEAEETYFKRALKKSKLDATRTPQIYGMYKVHKTGAPKMRPVVSCINSIPEIFSKWVDYWLKKIVRSILPTYLRDTEDLMRKLEERFPNGLPAGAKLFSVDAVGMYANIDTNHGVEVLTTWLREHGDQLPRATPVDFLIDALSEIMKNNILQFGDTVWRQTKGCAMGTSAAVNYAYLYVGLLEIQRLLPQYQTSLLFFKRFIDDGIGVWLDPPGEPNSWQRFFACLNNWGQLRWTCDGHVNSLVFMDLNLSIGPGRKIVYSTYQKEMNLYLYIPPGSAHPKNMIRDLVYGRLRAYWLQNTYKKDFYRMAGLLARRLIVRGYTLEYLLPFFQAAEARLTNLLRTGPRRNPDVSNAGPGTTKNAEQTKPLFFHLQFHPRGIQRKQIREAYNDTLAPLLESERRLIVAVSRPRNLRDRVCSTRLPDVTDNNPSDFIICGDNSHSPQILPEG
jgi:hypothetical protein